MMKTYSENEKLKELNQSLNLELQNELSSITRDAEDLYKAIN
jgi:hypothetical protein